MSDPLDILITGSEGFIGKALGESLAMAGHRVWGVDRICPAGGQTFQADLLDAEQTCRAFASVPHIDVVVHTAALAHGQRPPTGYTRASFNTTVTANVLKALGDRNPRLIFLSSVAVYGEQGRTQPVGVAAQPKPATDYGRGKLECEQLILNSQLAVCDILRLAPVYNAVHQKDLKKRVCMPLASFIKLWLIPEPAYSLCQVETLTQHVVNLVARPGEGRRIAHVADPTPYAQHVLVSWFSGVAVPLPRIFLWPCYWATYLLPSKLGYALRCNYWKLFHSNIYRTDAEMRRG